MITSWIHRHLHPGPRTIRGGEAPQWIVRAQPDHREYHGTFMLFDGRGNARLHVRGVVVEWPGLPVEVFVQDPPLRLRLHRHGRCLQLLTPNGNWFKLHWQRPARSFDQARAYVEQLLDESMSG